MKRKKVETIRTVRGFPGHYISIVLARHSLNRSQNPTLNSQQSRSGAGDAPRPNGARSDTRSAARTPTRSCARVGRLERVAREGTFDGRRRGEKEGKQLFSSFLFVPKRKEQDTLHAGAACEKEVCAAATRGCVSSSLNRSSSAFRSASFRSPFRSNPLPLAFSTKSLIVSSCRLSSRPDLRSRSTRRFGTARERKRPRERSAHPFSDAHDASLRSTVRNQFWRRVDSRAEADLVPEALRRGLARRATIRARLAPLSSRGARLRAALRRRRRELERAPGDIQTTTKRAPAKCSGKMPRSDWQLDRASRT